MQAAERCTLDNIITYLSSTYPGVGHRQCERQLCDCCLRVCFPIADTIKFNTFERIVLQGSALVSEVMAEPDIAKNGELKGSSLCVRVVKDVQRQLLDHSHEQCIMEQHAATPSVFIHCEEQLEPNDMTVVQAIEAVVARHNMAFVAPTVLGTVRRVKEHKLALVLDGLFRVDSRIVGDIALSIDTHFSSVHATATPGYVNSLEHPQRQRLTESDRTRPCMSLTVFFRTCSAPMSTIVDMTMVPTKSAEANFKVTKRRPGTAHQTDTDTDYDDGASGHTSKRAAAAPRP